MSDSKEFVFNSSDGPLRVVVLGILIPGIVLSFMVLMAFAYAASQRSSRPHLHRVSFRLLVYALLSHLADQALSLVSPLIPMEGLMTEPIAPAACTFAAFASNSSLLFSACMYTSMAINLQLVLIHGVNGLMMEKYYVIGSSPSCGRLNPNPDLRYRWMVGTQSFWLFLMASLELVCFVILMSYMLRRRMVMKRIRSDISAEMTATQNAAYSAAPIVQFRAIILRITLYPSLSCILGFSGTSIDLYLAKHLGNSKLNDTLTTLDHCIFNARPLMYALLAATDPSFLRAMGALRNQSTRTAKSQFQGSRSTVLSLYKWTLSDWTKTEGESSENMRRMFIPLVREIRRKGVEQHSNVVESRKESIEYQI
ncbi:hypothetical protein MSAN_01623500 [Mycena sanguinolenta]|uniref:Uncharacterized protein n=1 Tax=Mycena sanguinolenta TaxID=230812 RepID=A0A8H6XZS5_9AGAR|nr:hypothetical protein MSAN_01623500 [Mycena sanguinolenta]